MAHWDEGWAAGRDWGLAEKGLKYPVVGCFVLFFFFKHTKIRYKELANTLHSSIRKGGLSCGSIKSKRGFYWGGGSIQQSEDLPLGHTSGCKHYGEDMLKEEKLY